MTTLMCCKCCRDNPRCSGLRRGGVAAFPAPPGGISWWYASAPSFPAAPSSEARASRSHHHVVRASRNAAQIACPKIGVGPVSTAVFPPEQPLRDRSREPLGGEPKLCVADVSTSESQLRWYIEEGVEGRIAVYQTRFNQSYKPATIHTTLHHITPARKYHLRHVAAEVEAYL